MPVWDMSAQPWHDFLTKNNYVYGHFMLILKICNNYKTQLTLKIHI